MAPNATEMMNEGLQAAFSPLFNRLALGVFILLVGFIIGRIAGLMCHRFLSGIGLDKHLRNAGFRFSAERLISWVLSVVIYIWTLIWSLDALGLTSTIFTLIIIGIIFILGISFLLAVKDFFPNIISGMRIRVAGMFSVGDYIAIREVKGRITSLGLLDTRLALGSGEEIIIPNSLFIKRKILVKQKKR